MNKPLRLSAKDADLTNLKAIKVNYDAAAGKTLKVLDLPEGHTAKSLIGCTVTAVNGAGDTVATWTETGATATLVVVRADGLYVTGRPVVKAGETEVTNNDLTLPLARRAAELSATSVNITGVVNTKDTEMSVNAAAVVEVFTNVIEMTETPDANGAVEAEIKYDFGVTKIGIAVIEGVKYVVLEVTVSNVVPNTRTVNTADFADNVSLVATEMEMVDGEVVEVGTFTTTEVTDMTGAVEGETTGPVRYVRFEMPTATLGTTKIGVKAKNEPAQQQ